jgi:hypothetical protein
MQSIQSPIGRADIRSSCQCSDAIIIASMLLYAVMNISAKLVWFSTMRKHSCPSRTACGGSPTRSILLPAQSMHTAIRNFPQQIMLVS